MTHDDWQGRRVTILGLGLFGGGESAARFAVERGAEVTVTDLADAQRLAGPVRRLEVAGVRRFQLGSHVESDFTDTDLVITNPAVRYDSRFLELARRSDVRITSEIELFMQRCRAPIVGVTGTNGKSTTAAMTAHMLSVRYKTWLGGNIGRSLLDQLDRIGANDRVVLELSSFQLYHLSNHCRLPEVAVVTSCTPNHLNWHGSFKHYAESKRRIIDTGNTNQTLIAGPESSDVTQRSGKYHSDAREGNILDTNNGSIEWLPDSVVPKLAVPGLHNRMNARLALAAALAASDIDTASKIDADTDPIGLYADHLHSFPGLPDRLETVCATELGVRLVNDSAATTPESVIAALNAIERPWLIAGGVSKGVELDRLAREIAARAAGIAIFGTIRDELQRAVRAVDDSLQCNTSERLSDSLAWCLARAKPGDTIVMSPGFASYDQYKNYVDRGRDFKQLARAQR